MRTEVKLNKENNILCPGCNSDHMKQGRVEVFNRYSQGHFDHGLHVIVAAHGEFVRADDNHDDNPSKDESGIIVAMTCEVCSSRFDLIIYQNNYRTFLEWNSE